MEASRCKQLMTLEEFTERRHRQSKGPKQVSASDLLSRGLNASKDAQRYLVHHKEALEKLRLKLSLLTFSNDMEAIKEIMISMEQLGVRILWPHEDPIEDLSSEKTLELYNDYIFNNQAIELHNRRNERLYNDSTVEERQLM